MLNILSYISFSRSSSNLLICSLSLDMQSFFSISSALSLVLNIFRALSLLGAVLVLNLIFSNSILLFLILASNSIFSSTTFFPIKPPCFALFFSCSSSHCTYFSYLSASSSFKFYLLPISSLLVKNSTYSKMSSSSSCLSLTLRSCTFCLVVQIDFNISFLRDLSSNILVLNIRLMYKIWSVVYF